jgi:hypothetical protein
MHVASVTNFGLAQFGIQVHYTQKHNIRTAHACCFPEAAVLMVNYAIATFNAL